MGSRGPMKLRVVQTTGCDDGTAGSRISADPPEMPSGLPLDVQELWEEIVPILADAGLLSRADGMTVEMALRHFVIARAASNSLIEGGIVVEDKRHGGQEAKSPRAQVFKDNSAAFVEYAKQLGLSFASRARVTMPKEADDDDNIFGVQNTGS